MENGNRQKVWGDQTVHAVTARFRKTRRYTKVVCCVLNLCTRFFHRKVQGDQILHAMSARFRKIYIYIYIYYYTPLPLNLANKQQQQQATSNKQQARLRAVLAIAPSQRLGPDSTLAILEPRWWPCQIQVLSQKLTGGGPRRGRQVGRCPPKSAQFSAKNSHFSPKTALVRVQNSQTKANGCYIPRAA